MAPTEHDTSLIVEVCDSGSKLERGLKWRIYASAGVPCYWIVNIARRQFEAFQTPEGQGRSATYRECVVFQAGNKVPVSIDGQLAGRVPLGGILT